MSLGFSSGQDATDYPGLAYCPTCQTRRRATFHTDPELPHSRLVECACGDTWEETR